jgi:hypothetical protein
MVLCRWAMSKPKFAWKDGSKWLPDARGFFATAVIYNVPNGIGAVHQQIGSEWRPIQPLQHLRNMWVMEEPANYRDGKGGEGESFNLRVFDIDGKSYGDFKVDFPCGSGVCETYTDAVST